jgi:hypothetical protein
MLTAEIALQLWRMDVHQYAYILCVKLLLSLGFVTHFQFNFKSKILQHLFPICSNSPATAYFLSM